MVYRENSGIAHSPYKFLKIAPLSDTKRYRFVTLYSSGSPIAGAVAPSHSPRGQRTPTKGDIYEMPIARAALASLCAAMVGANPIGARHDAPPMPVSLYEQATACGL